MADSYMVVTEKDWADANEDQRSWMTFNTMRVINERLKTLEKKSFIHKSITFIGAIIGGALAYIGLKSLT